MSTIRLEELKGSRIGRVLRKIGKITREQVEEVLRLQMESKKGELFGQICVGLGWITDEDILMALAAQRGLGFVNLETVQFTDEILNAVKPETATAFSIVPIAFEAASRKITVALKNPENFQAVDDLRQLLGFKVTAVCARPDQIDAILRERYAGKRGNVADAIAAASNSAALAGLEGRGDSIDMATLQNAANENAVVELVQQLLMIAIRDKASDIHFEPFEDEFKVRYRIDGVLYEMAPVNKSLATALVSRVKVMSKLDIAERRLPQDGRIEL
ncbi:MAG: GspE/PulE family protein, partial [Planctomycetota bacterium]